MVEKKRDEAARNRISHDGNSIVNSFFLLSTFLPYPKYWHNWDEIIFRANKRCSFKKKLIMMNRSIWPFFKWTGTFFVNNQFIDQIFFEGWRRETFFSYPLTFENEKLQLKIAEKKILHSHLAAFIDFFRSESSASETSTRKSNLSGMITWEKIS